MAFAAIASCSAQLLYKITGPGITSPSYLMGTHHLAPQSILDSIQGFTQALDGVEAVYGEVVQSELMSPEVQQYTMTLAMAPADSTLSKVLSPAQLDSLNTVVKKYTMGMASASSFEPMTPAIVSTQLALLQSMQAFPDFNPTKQLDVTIQQMAAERGKANGGLESARSQIDKLFGTSIAKQANDLMEMVRHDDRAADVAHRLAQAYLNQDLDALWQITTDHELDPDADDLDRLIFSRNRAWVEQMPTLMSTRPTLFVVGAGHLPTPQGLIELLRARGYTVEPVK